MQLKIDADENASDLDEMDGEEDFVFPPAERKVITQPVDLSISSVLEQWDLQQLTLPPIQREYVWDNGKASRLAESLILNIPVPVLYFAETKEAKYEIIDGHQRVRSVVRFLKNEFSLSGLAVLREYKGMRFHQLPEREQRFLRMRTLRAIIISVDSHPNMKFEIFERLNTGAISLNAQELRNSIYRGSLNELLHQLVKDPVLRRLLGTKTPRRRMVDEELLLRFFALRSSLGTYRTPLKRFLNGFMLSMKDAPEDDLNQLAHVFTRSVQCVEDVFGPAAFRNLDPAGNPSESTVNRALFDAQLLAASWISTHPTAVQAKAARLAIAKLFSDEGFLDSIQRATGDRARTLRRLRETVAAMESAGIEFLVPFDLSK